MSIITEHPIPAVSLQRKLLDWFDEHGRKDLPWQKNINPYRVWVSEIMLQQTQVSTVIDYFHRFMARFPTVEQLATANTDDVLALWTGLGYYARARNLHRAAQIIVDEHQGDFPNDSDTLQTLPGIGRSTAGAILSIAKGQTTAILDGNVKRVLCRLHAVSGWPGQSATLKQLWQLAEKYTPSERNADYTQAIMDLGATLCKRGQPNCPACPLAQHCLAYAQGNPSDYPESKPRKELPTKVTRLLIIQQQQQVLLEKRPPAGIWGGLWSFPECSPETDPVQYLQEKYSLTINDIQHGKMFRHTFSHFHLEITPVYASCSMQNNTINNASDHAWCDKQQSLQRGLAAPVKRLLETIQIYRLP